MTPAVGLVAAGTVLSVPYLCNVHLVFASGRSDGPRARHPAVSLALGTAGAWLAGDLVGLAAAGVGMTVTYAAMAARHGLAGPPGQPDPVALAVPGPGRSRSGFALCLLGGRAGRTTRPLAVRRRRSPALTVAGRARLLRRC